MNYEKKLTREQSHNTGLYYANMGSIYDVPQSSRQNESTKAGSLMEQSALKFEKSERAILKQPFSTFYTSTNEKPVEVKFDR